MILIPKKVLILYWGRRGGGLRYTQKLTEELARSSSIDVYASFSDNADKDVDFSFLQDDRCINVSTYSNIFQFIVASFFLPLKALRVISFLRRNQIEVVISSMHHLWNPIIAAFIKLAGLKYVLVVHDAKPHSGERSFISSFLLYLDIRQAHRLIALSDNVWKELVTLNFKPSSSIIKSSLGVYGFLQASDSPRQLPSSKAINILFFGRIHDYKGLDILLESSLILQDLGFNFTLEVWGEGDLRPYRQLINMIERSRVYVCNRWVAESEILGIFRRADLVALPYRECTQSGIVELAWCSALPIVATPSQGLLDQLRHTNSALFSNDFTPQSFSQTLLQIGTSISIYKSTSRYSLQAFTSASEWPRIRSEFEKAIEFE